MSWISSQSNWMRRKTWLRAAAVIILLTGYAGAFLAWRAQERRESADQSYLAIDGAVPLSTMDSRHASGQVEVYYGKGGVMMENAVEWFSNLWQGENLPKTLVALSSLLAVALFLAALWLPASG